MKLLSAAATQMENKVLMAVLCLRDNVRTDAVETVEILNNAGIQVVMVTGDAEETAGSRHFQKEAGILKRWEECSCSTYEELEQMSDEELKKNFRTRVVSRAKPLDKKTCLYFTAAW